LIDVTADIEAISAFGHARVFVDVLKVRLAVDANELTVDVSIGIRPAD
jgi:hypothetical protein